MLTVARLRRKPRHFTNFTGLSLEQFGALLAELTPHYEQAEHQRLNRLNRRRAVGAGYQFHLPLAERLLLTLLYHRL